MNLGFRYFYTTFKCKFNNLTSSLADTSDLVKIEGKEHYFDPSVEIDTFKKIGFRKYVVIWKVTGQIIKT